LSELCQKRLQEIVGEIAKEAASRLKEKGVSPMGPDAVRRQQPREVPVSTKKSPAPLYLAATKQVRDDLRATYYAFLAAFRETSERLKAGDRSAVFPLGSSPSAMSFVDGWSSKPLYPCHSPPRQSPRLGRKRGGLSGQQAENPFRH
jgi:hypothetical protein